MFNDIQIERRIYASGEQKMFTTLWMLLIYVGISGREAYAAARVALVYVGAYQILKLIISRGLLKD